MATPFAEKPLATIITPALNARRHLPQCLQSIQEQAYPALEHIVIDGGSTDGTLDIIRSRSPGSIVVSEPDEGTSEAINKGFRMARGEYVWILNADDALAGPETVSVLADYLDKHPDCDFVFGDMVMIDKNGKRIGVRRFARNYGLDNLFLDRRHLPFAGCLARKATVDRLGGFDPSLKFCNDLDFFIRLASTGTMSRIPIETGVFRIHDDSSTSSNIYQTGSETFAVCSKLLEQADVAARLQTDKRIIL